MRAGAREPRNQKREIGSARCRQSSSSDCGALSRLWSLAVIIVAGLLLAACEQATVGVQPPVTVTIAGSTAMQPVLLDLTAAYTEQHPNIVFDVRQGGSTLGEEWVQDGRIDVAASTLLPPSAAIDATALLRTPIGLDGIAVIVHPDNPAAALTAAELRDLYTGRLLNWSALGGRDEDVLLVSREDGSGTRRHFEARITGDEAAALTSIVMPTSAAVVEYVAAHPGAIGYVTRAYLPPPTDGSSGPVDERVRMLAIDGLLPTDEALSQQAYPLPQPLYLIAQDRPDSVVRSFVDYALSPAGQEVVARYHVPVR